MATKIYTQKEQASNLLKAKKDKPKLGSGVRFKNLVKELSKKNKGDSKALAAWIGRNRYGKIAMKTLSIKKK